MQYRPFPYLLLATLLFFAASMGSAIPRDACLEPSFGRLPLYFIENRGQLDEEVAYYVQGSDKSLYFTAEGITFALLKEEGWTKGWTLKLDFLGADPDVKPRGEDKQRAVFSYFKGRPEDWRAGIPTFGKLVYEDLWPGIDLVYSGTVDKLKYEFVVEPGADPKQIKLSFRGATEVSVKETGELSVSTPLGGFEDGVPFAYQVIEDQQKEVSMRYSLGDESDKDSFFYGFELGAYDETKPLVLDPVILVYCGYLGGSSEDEGRGIALDGSGNAYVTGGAKSTDFPVSVGPFLSNSGSQDVFVTKVKADGSALVYSGFIGGSTEDGGYDIAVDGSGNAYITGYTWSSDFPVLVGPFLSLSEWVDAFVTKVKADGTGLIYSGFMGGEYNDRGRGIAVDVMGHAYLAGDTDSSDFPAVVGPFLTKGQVTDAFVAKIKVDGSGLVYCGFLGGMGSDYGHDIAVDGSGNAYVTGTAAYTDFPVLVGPFLSNSGVDDAYVTKVKSDGTGLVYSGFLGGSYYDHGRGIAVDGSGNAYVTGYTASTDYPVLVGPSVSNSGDQDVFITKVKVDGSGLVYSGYLGGSLTDQGNRIAVDESGNAFVTGVTRSTDFPVFVGPYLSHGGAYYDAFVAEIKTDGSGFVYCGYLGGSGEDYGYDIAVDESGRARVTGKTSSTDFPVMVGPFLTNSGSYDAFVTKVELSPMWYVDDDNTAGPWLGTQQHPFQHIQDAIDSAMDEDSVLVLPGTYLENIDFLGKAVTVMSSDGPKVTVIDGGQSGSVVSCTSAEGPDSVLEGFTLTNGSGSGGSGFTYGGGVNCYTGSPTIRNNIFQGNSASEGGGGIYCQGLDCAPIITGNILTGNTAGYGAAISCGYGPASPEITNNLVYANHATGPFGGYGGGMYFLDYSPKVTNNTVYGNSAETSGGGIMIFQDAAPQIANTIFWNNFAPEGPEMSLYFTSTLSIDHSDVEGGQASAYVDATSRLNWGTGMIDADPICLVPAVGNFHIKGDSPCIDAGDNNALALPATDFEGDPRIVDGDFDLQAVADMGCDEFNPLRVPQDYSTIQAAIDAASEGGIIHVDPGTYMENIDFKGKAVMVTSIGNAGSTVIDGSLSGPVATFKNGEGPDAVLHGFTLKNGHAPNGGGVYCYDHSSPTVQGNIITGNIATSTGGGIFCYTYSSPRIANNFIHDNNAGQGGGIRVRDHSYPTIVNNTIVENSAANSGGGILCADSNPVIFNAILWNNSAPLGPQIHVVSGNPTVSYSDIEGGFAGTANINENPRFSEPMSNDFHLDGLSPCINRGTNTGAPAIDFDEDSRPSVGTVDMGADEFTDIHALSADAFFLDEDVGCINTFYLDAGPSNGGRMYAILGSLSGTNPGIPLPKGKAVLPLNWDYYTNLVLNNLNSPFFQNFYGTLDASGQATATLFLGPAPGSAGLVMSYAYALLNPFDFASNPVNILIIE